MDNDKRKKILKLLKRAYGMELETVMNYLAASVNLDGIRAKHVGDALAADITEELGHAQRLAKRIKVLEGDVPGSMSIEMTQKALQPTGDSLDVRSIVTGVIAAEEEAVETYQKLIEAAEGVDPVTQDLCIQLKGDEEEHRRMFRGFLNELDRAHALA